MPRIDFPQNPSKPDTYLNGQDSGQQELISLASAISYPTGLSPVRAGQVNEVPATAYDVRRCRGCTVQLSTYGVTGAGVVQVQVSVDGKSYAPLPVQQAGAFVTNIAVPTGGTALAPVATILVIDAPWFAWLRVVITTPATTGNALLSVYKRD